MTLYWIPVTATNEDPVRKMPIYLYVDAANVSYLQLNAGDPMT